MIYVDQVGNDHQYYVPVARMKGAGAPKPAAWLRVHVDGRHVAFVRRVHTGARSWRWQMRKSMQSRPLDGLFPSIPDALRYHSHVVAGVCRVCRCWERGLKATCAEFGPCGWQEPDLCTVCHELLRAGFTEKDIRKANRGAWDPTQMYGALRALDQAEARA